MPLSAIVCSFPGRRHAHDALTLDAAGNARAQYWFCSPLVSPLATAIHRSPTSPSLQAHAEHAAAAEAGAAPKLADVQPDGTTAPLLHGIGPLHVPISTTSEQAQKYFDQGFTLMYGFNHHEAIRSFKEAARLDPTCGICWWGVALSYGPNINQPMEKDAIP